MWNSRHIFIHDYSLLDKFLKTKLLPFLDDYKSCDYFFIRYWDGGPHIRLRYKLDIPEEKRIFEEKLEHMLRDFKEKNLDYKFNPVIYDEDILTLENVEPSKIYPNFSIQEILYYPELNRYGGENVMDKSEKLFSSSSKFTSSIIQSFERNQIYSIAIDIMYACARIAKECGYFKDYEDFFNAYRQIWEKFSGVSTIPELSSIIKRRVKKMNEGNISNKFYKNYFQDFRLILEDIKKNQKAIHPDYIMYIAISHIHMTNNRLGISPEQEYMFSNALLEVV